MYELVQAVVTRLIKYNDKQMVAVLYTAQRGRVACLTPAGDSAEARRRRALLMPMSLVECLVDFRPGREVYNMRDLRSIRPMPNLVSDARKVTVAMFAAEVAWVLLREPEPDRGMFGFLSEWVSDLEQACSGVGNFPILFLMRMQRFLGIEPDWSEWRRGSVFDMLEGAFSMSTSVRGGCLSAEEASVGRQLSRMTSRSARLFRMSREQRNEVLDRIMDYYRLHDFDLSGLRSLEVLRSVFG